MTDLHAQENVPTVDGIGWYSVVSGYAFLATAFAPQRTNG